MVESFRDSDSVYIASVYYINLGIPGSKTEAGAVGISRIPMLGQLLRGVLHTVS